MTKPSGDLIFDRTQADVDSDTLKGQYNASDLNRVEKWCEFLADELNAVGYSINITCKTNWVQTDMRTSAEMERIRTNIKAIMQGYYYLTQIQQNAEFFNYIKANNWEQILNEIYWLMFGMKNYYVSSGVANAGQRRIYQNRFRHFYPHALEGTGTQYIDTGIKAQVGIKVEMEFSFTNLVGQAPFGCHYNAPNMSFLIVGTPLRWSMITNGTQKTDLNETPQNNTNYKAEFYVGENEQYLKINGENLISNTLTITGINAYNLYLFKRNSSSSPSPASMKLYYCKIWIGDTLVRDFVPTLTNDIPCLYDNVTQTSFYNAGTGDFIYN